MEAGRGGHRGRPVVGRRCLVFTRSRTPIQRPDLLISRGLRREMRGLPRRYEERPFAGLRLPAPCSRRCLPELPSGARPPNQARTGLVLYTRMRRLPRRTRGIDDARQRIRQNMRELPRRPQEFALRLEHPFIHRWTSAVRPAPPRLPGRPEDQVQPSGAHAKRPQRTEWIG